MSTQYAMKYFTEEVGVEYLAKPADYGSAGKDCPSIKLGLHRRLTFIIGFGALTGNSVLSVYSGATTGAKTTQEKFSYRLANAAQGAANADVFGAATQDVTSLTLTAATYANKILTVEFDPAQLSVQGQDFITCSVDATATVLNMAILGIARGPRYSQNAMDTVLL